MSPVTRNGSISHQPKVKVGDSRSVCYLLRVTMVALIWTDTVMYEFMMIVLCKSQLNAEESDDLCGNVGRVTHLVTRSFVVDVIRNMRYRELGGWQRNTA